MNILEVGPPHIDPAAGQRIQAASRAMADRGHRVTSLGVDPMDSRIGYVPMESRISWQGLSDLGTVSRQIHEAVQDTAPDVVHANGWAAGVAALAALRGVETPVVFSPHGMLKRAPIAGEPEMSTEHRNARSRLERVVARSCAVARASHTAEAEDLVRAGVPRHRCAVVPFGLPDDLMSIPTHQPPGRSREDRTARAIYLSGLGPGSGIETMLRALVHTPGLNLEVSGADEPDFVGAARQIANEAGVGQRVSFLHGPATVEQMWGVDMVIADPWSTGFGDQVLAAMAAGRAVVASAVGGHVDVVIDEVTGRLIPPRRADVLASTLRKLLADPFELHCLGRAGADRARTRYAWARIAEELERTFTLATRQGARPTTASPTIAGAKSGSMAATRGGVR